MFLCRIDTLLIASALLAGAPLFSQSTIPHHLMSQRILPGQWAQSLDKHFLVGDLAGMGMSAFSKMVFIGEDTYIHSTFIVKDRLCRPFQTDNDDQISIVSFGRSLRVPDKPLNRPMRLATSEEYLDREEMLIQQIKGRHGQQIEEALEAEKQHPD
jgi:hypothetical protein